MNAPRQISPVLLVLTLWLSGLGAAMQFAKVTVSFSALQTVYAGSDAALGFLLSSIGVLGVFLGLVAGQMVASFGYKRMLVWALLLGGLLSAFQALLPALGLFLLSRVAEGVSHLAIVVAAPTLMALLTPPNWRFLAMTLWSAFFGVGYALAAAVGPWLIATYGDGAAFLAHAIFMLGMSALAVRVLPQGAAAREPFPNLPDLIKRHIAAYRSPREFAPAAGWLFYTCTFVALLTVLPSVLPKADALVTLPLMPVAGILSSFTLGAALLRVLPAVTVLQIGLGASIALSLLAASLPLSGWLFVAIFAALGLVQSASFAAIPQLNPAPTSQALANGAMAQMGNLGNLIGTPLMFALLTGFGTPSLYVMLVGCFGLAMAAHAFLAHLRSREPV